MYDSRLLVYLNSVSAEDAALRSVCVAWQRTRNCVAWPEIVLNWERGERGKNVNGRITLAYHSLSPNLYDSINMTAFI